MRYLKFVVMAIALLLVLSACAVEAPPPAAPAASQPTTEPQEDMMDEGPLEVFDDFDPNNFGRSTTIDNPYLPLQPGTQWVFEGNTVDEGEIIPHRLEFTVTDLTKEIEGVRTVVTWIRDISDGEVVEKEIAFYAQDNDGIVWFFGEHPEEYEDGEFAESSTWIAGLAGARAGIKMWAQPQLGLPSYFQGWAPAVEWSDYGQVEQLGQTTCVRAGCYDDVLTIAESSLEEENAFQLKYYARGVGNVLVGWRGADATHENLELVELNQLSPEDLAEVRAEALELEAHAYEVSEDVYGLTSPSE